MSCLAPRVVKVMVGLVFAAGFMVMTQAAVAGPGHDHGGSVSEKMNVVERESYATRTFGERLQRTLLLQDYNTRVVVLGTAPLGIAAGVVGVFLLLRKRSLLTDALSHATLPGIMIAFMVMVAFWGEGKSLPGLLLGALITGLIGMASVALIRGYSRLKDDAALGIVLSVFFGIGIFFQGIVKQLNVNVAGLNTLILGKTEALTFDYAVMMSVIAVVAVVVCLLLMKELTIVCFDEGFAGAQGWPVGVVDVTLMTVVVVVTVIGLHAVGLILIIALLIIPAAAARFWSDRLGVMLIISGFIGMVSTYVGSTASAVIYDLPTGAVIVLGGAAMFAVSLVFGSKRGLVVRWRRQSKLRGKVGRQHLLRGMFEELESQGISRAVKMPGHSMHVDRLLDRRSWKLSELSKELRKAVHAGLVEAAGKHHWALTPEGAALAGRTVRNHRLWEIYLITHAEIAPSHVDRDADAIEHVLGTKLTRELEAVLTTRYPGLAVPPSPHEILKEDRYGAGAMR